MLVSHLGRDMLEGKFMGQLSWEPPARQLGAGQSRREEFNTDEMSLWKAGEAAGAVPLHKCTGVGLWRGLRPFDCTVCPRLPVLCKALGSASISSSAHFNLLPSHFSASRRTGLFRYFISSHPPFPS